MANNNIGERRECKLVLSWSMHACSWCDEIPWDDSSDLVVSCECWDEEGVDEVVVVRGRGGGGGRGRG